MATATRTATIAAPIEEVWPVLADFTGTYRWNPVVPVSYPVGDKTTGIGARRRCEFNDDGSKWLEEHIIAFDEANHRYTLRLIEGTEKPPIDDVQVEIAAKRVSAEATEVTMTATLIGRGPIKKAIAWVGSLALRRVLSRLMVGLDRHITTGDEITDLKKLRQT